MTTEEEMENEFEPEIIELDPVEDKDFIEKFALESDTIPELHLEDEEE